MQGRFIIPTTLGVPGSCFQSARELGVLNQNHPETTPRERLIRIDEVLAVVPISRSSWYAGIKAGIFPRQLKLGRRISAWREQDVLALVNRGAK